MANLKETLKVHKYPDEKPTRYDDFSILIIIDECYMGFKNAGYNVVNDQWWSEGGYNPIDNEYVVAWIDWKEALDE